MQRPRTGALPFRRRFVRNSGYKLKRTSIPNLAPFQTDPYVLPNQYRVEPACLLEAHPGRSLVGLKRALDPEGPEPAEAGVFLAEARARWRVGAEDLGVARVAQHVSHVGEEGDALVDLVLG